jgi:hypothetical protein
MTRIVVVDTVAALVAPLLSAVSSEGARARHRCALLSPLIRRPQATRR